MHVPKLVADASRVFATGVLLFAAVGLLIAALGTGHVGLAWVSVTLSAVAAVMILRRWRRSWLTRQDTPEDEPALLLEDEPSSASPENAQLDNPVGDDSVGEVAPGEEATDAADLLVVFELTDAVLVVDEQPRYHLTRCRWPDQARAEQMPVREARELGFTPCARCRPDTTLVRKHRTARAPASGGG